MKPPIWYACLNSPPHRKGVFHIMPLETYLKSKQYRSERSLSVLSKAIAYALCFPANERLIEPWRVVKNAIPEPKGGWDEVCIIPTKQNPLRLIGVNFTETKQYKNINEQVLSELSLIANRPGYIYSLIDSIYAS
jgi:hypothetical protein